MLDVILSYLEDILYVLPAIVISLTFHECAHGFVAYKLGDPTAKDEGRLTLNPIRHIDPLGFILMIVLRFGWAKPVPVNPMYFENPKKGMLITSIAGPASNLILAFISSLVLTVIYMFCPANAFTNTLFTFFLLLTYLNIGLAVFNLIPVYPLDGSRILGYFMPRSFTDFFIRYGQYIGIAFFVLVLATDVVSDAVYFVQSNLSDLLITFWSRLISLLIPF